MRVIHAVRSDAFGGVERYISNVAPALHRRGVEVGVIGGASDQMCSVLEHGVDFHPAATTVEVFRELLRERRCDLVHVHMTAAELAAAPLKLVRRWRLVTTRHFGSERGSRAITRPLVRLAAHAIDQEIAPSHFVARQLRRQPLVLHHGVADRPPAGERRPTVLLAQRLESEKGTAVVLQSWAMAGLAAQGWRLLIAGDGSERQHLEQRAAELGVASTVDFLGRRDDVHDLMDRASIFVATGRNEAFGLAAVEAMASGAAVVASSSGGHLETVGAVSSDPLYPYGDAHALANLLDRLGEASIRDNIAHRQQDHQRRHLSLDAHVDALVGIYSEVLGRP